MQRSQMLRSGASRSVSRPVLARATAPASPMAHLLDAGVLPQQQMMQAGKLSSHALTSQYLARIRSLCSIGARAYPGIEINPDALENRPGNGPRAASAQGARPLARHSRRLARQYRHGRPHEDAHAGAPGHACQLRFLRGGALARGRRRHHRQKQFAPVGCRQRAACQCQLGRADHPGRRQRGGRLHRRARFDTAAWSPSSPRAGPLAGRAASQPRPDRWRPACARRRGCSRP